IEFIFHLGGEARRDLRLLAAEDIHGESMRGDKRFVRLYIFLDADEHERRMKRERRERRHGHAEWFCVELRRHHGHSAREVRHGQFELRVIDRHLGAPQSGGVYKLSIFCGVYGGRRTSSCDAPSRFSRYSHSSRSQRARRPMTRFANRSTSAMAERSRSMQTSATFTSRAAAAAR